MIRRGIAIGTLALVMGVAPVVAQTKTLPELRAEAEAKRGQIKLNAKEHWEELKATREAQRAQNKQEMQTKREEVKAKVTAMRDVRKKQVVERVQSKISDINTRRTDHFLKVLERLSTILDKIQSRTEKAKAEGKNVTSIESAIASARTAISSAESTVNTQKAKTYQITVTDDTTARNDVGATAKQLESDIRAVQDTVQVARQAVQNVFQQIKTIVGSGAGTIPSTTATGSSVDQ